MEDGYKYKVKYKVKYEQIRVASPLTSFMMEPCIYLDEKISPVPLKVRAMKTIKRITFIIGVILAFLVILITGAVLVAVYCPILTLAWFVFSFGLGYVAAELLFD